MIRGEYGESTLLWQETLLAVQKDGKLSNLWKVLKVTKGSLYNRLKRMERAGLVINQNQRWHITEKGRTYSHTHRMPEARTIEARWHHITVAIAHKCPKLVWKKKFEGSIVKLYIPQLDEVVTFQLTPKTAQFNLRLQRTSNILTDVNKLHETSIKAVSRLEKHLKVRFVRPTDLGQRKLYSELAYLKTGLAESEMQKGRKIWFYSWEDDGKPRFLFDKSKGNPEFENVGKTVDDDALETAWFLEKLASGELREQLEEAQDRAKSEADFAKVDELQCLIQITEGIFEKDIIKISVALGFFSKLNLVKASQLNNLLIDTFEWYRDGERNG